MKERGLILGAGFAGMDLATSLSETHGGTIAVTLIDQADSFMFDFSKLDVLFQKSRGTSSPFAVPRIPQAGV